MTVRETWFLLGAAAAQLPWLLGLWIGAAMSLRRRREAGDVDRDE